MRRVKEGTSAVLLQSGLNESWWADSMECYTFLRNVTDLFSDGKTPYERFCGQPFKGPIIPFGVEGMNPAPHIHEHLRYTIMATALRTPSRITTCTCLSTLR